MVVSGNGVFTCDNIWDESPEFYFFSKGIEETVPYDIISIPGGKLVSVIGDYDGLYRIVPKNTVWYITALQAQ